MEKVVISTEYIKLDQLLKWTGVSENGAVAKMQILEGKVKVNGNIEKQRGKKIRCGDTVEIEDNMFLVQDK